MANALLTYDVSKDDDSTIREQVKDLLINDHGYTRNPEINGLKILIDTDTTLFKMGVDPIKAKDFLIKFFKQNSNGHQITFVLFCGGDDLFAEKINTQEVAVDRIKLKELMNKLGKERNREDNIL